MGFPSYKDVDVCVAMMETNRESWQRPDIISRLITSPDMTVVDLGAGTGYFTDLFSKHLPGGKVIALEPEITLISCLEDRKRKDSLNNVSIHQIEEEIPGLDQLNTEIDLLFIGYTYFHFPEPVKYFRDNVYAFIQEKTVVAIADLGGENQMRHVVPAQQVIAEMAEAGFRLEGEPTILYEQYLLVFKKANVEFK